MTNTNNPLPGVKALLFDVFGTVVDWRGCTAQQLHEQCQKTLSAATDPSPTGKPHPPAVNARQHAIPPTTLKKGSEMTYSHWLDFSKAWIEAHSEHVWHIALSNIAGTDPGQYKNIDRFQAESLPGMLANWGLTGLWNEDMLQHMSRVLHRLRPWPDSVGAIKALNAAGYQTVTLSNGNVALLENMASHSELEWTHILSAEMWETYKPDPAIFTGAAEKLGLKTEKCALVASHMYDLEAAKRVGYRTVYVERVGEEKWEGRRVEECRGWVDVWVGVGEGGLGGVVERLGG